jgi:hypothetical protein
MSRYLVRQRLRMSWSGERMLAQASFLSLEVSSRAAAAMTL